MTWPFWTIAAVYAVDFIAGVYLAAAGEPIERTPLGVILNAAFAIFVLWAVAS